MGKRVALGTWGCVRALCTCSWAPRPQQESGRWMGHARRPACIFMFQSRETWSPEMLIALICDWVMSPGSIANVLWRYYAIVAAISHGCALASEAQSGKLLKLLLTYLLGSDRWWHLSSVKKGFHKWFPWPVASLRGAFVCSDCTLNSMLSVIHRFSNVHQNFRLGAGVNFMTGKPKWRICPTRPWWNQDVNRGKSGSSLWLAQVYTAQHLSPTKWPLPLPATKQSRRSPPNWVILMHNHFHQIKGERLCWIGK